MKGSYRFITFPLPKNFSYFVCRLSIKDKEKERQKRIDANREAQSSIETKRNKETQADRMTEGDDTGNGSQTKRQTHLAFVVPEGVMAPHCLPYLPCDG